MFDRPAKRLVALRPIWADTTTVDQSVQWEEDWLSAAVVNSHLVCDPTIQQPWFRPAAPFLDTVEPFLNKAKAHVVLKCINRVLRHLHSVIAESNRPWSTLSTRVRSQNWMAACWASTKQKRMPAAGWRWRWRRHSWNEMNSIKFSHMVFFWDTV